MKKKKKYTILFILLLLVIFVGGFFLFERGTGISGTSVLSLSQVDLESSYSNLDGKVWVYTFTQGGLGQQAKFTVSPDKASQEHSGKESPENQFTFSVNYDKQQCEYPTKIHSYSTSYHDGQIYDVKLVEYGRAFSCDTSTSKLEQECAGWTPLLFYSDSGFKTGCNVICGLRRTGQVGRLENPQINSEFTITVSSDTRGDDGKTSYSTSFSTTKNTKGEVGEHTYIIWNGNLNTGKQCKDQNPYLPIYRNGKWQLVSSNAYDDYSDSLDDLISNTKSDEDAEFKINAIKSQMNKALNSISLGSFDNEQSQTNALFILDVENQDLVKPVITAYVEADWIGIKTPIGKPKIVSVDAPTFRSSSDGQVKVSVKNIGDDLGTFTIYGECSDSSIDVYDSKEISVSVGQTQTVYLGVTSQVSKKTDFDCKIIAQGTQYEDRESFDITVDIAGKECEPNEKTCNPDGNIYKCNLDGTKRELYESCSNGCTNDEYGQPYCEEDSPPPPPPPDDNECKPLIDIKNPVDESKSWIKIDNPFCNLKTRLSTISIVIGILTTLAVFVIGKKNFYDNKPKRKQQSLDLILVLLFAGTSGFLAYFLIQNLFDYIFSFWGIVTIIITLLVLFFLNKIKSLFGFK